MSDIIRRAFVLASSGCFQSVDEIVKALKNEKFSDVDAHMAGGFIRNQLKQKITESQQSAASLSQP